MRNKWKNQIKVIGYLALIMLLLFGSLPLSGVLAESNQDEEKTDQDVEEENVQTNQEEIEMVQIEQTEEEASVEQQTSDTRQAALDAYLFSGSETVTVTRSDGSVINQGEAFLREYSVTLDNYHNCAQNMEGNQLLYATYVVRQEDNILQSGKLKLGEAGGDVFQIEYTKTGEYIIEIKASAYEEINGEYIWILDRNLSTVTDSVEKAGLQLQGSMEKEGHFSYREDYGKSVALSFFVEKYQAEKDGDISFTISSSNEAVIKPQLNQEVYTMIGQNPTFVVTGVGQAEIIIQPMEHDFYFMEKLVIPVCVENSPMQDEDYRILYTDIDGNEILFSGEYLKWQEFIEQKKHWINGSISIQLSPKGAQLYTGLGFSTNQEDNNTAEQNELVFSGEKPISQYEFWCTNTQNHATTRETENGTREFQVGIDRTAPQNTEFSYNQNVNEATSTETIRYYGENVIITGAFEDVLSGVEYIEYTTQADLGENAQWEKILNTVQDGKNTTFELSLEQGIYTGIAVRATDVAGNKSQPVEIKSKTGEFLKIIVDKTEPILDIMLKTADGKAYQSKWTNQPITIAVQEASTQPVLAGIQSIQYQYVSIGSEYQTDEWTELPSKGFLDIGNDKACKTDKNGTYYFRAISNTGMITNIVTQKNSAVRIRQQQILAEKKPLIETLPQLESNQEWYNKETGVPLIQFVYPEYDNGVMSLEYAAPVTVHSRLTAKDSDEKEVEVIYKSATIGIDGDEKYRQLAQMESDNINENTDGYIREAIQENIDVLNIDFSYDKQTGYAQDGIYELEYWISDAAGNESEHDIYTYKIDTHEPTALEVLIDGTPMESDTSQTILYDRFYQSSVSGSASADFGISGKGFIKLMLAKEIGAWEKNTDWINSDSFVIRPCTSGCIYMTAEDVAGNRSILRTQGIVVDNQPPTGENGGKFITITSKPNENHFYSDEVQVRFTANDLPQNTGFSALESFSCVIGTTGKENKVQKELFSFTKSLPSKEELASARSYAVIENINAAMFEGNDTYVEITVKDRCGNIATSREELKIDITPPQVEITFDQNEGQNGCYYNMARTATIHVQELNFDSTGIELEITKDGAPYSIPLSEWQSEGSDHFAKVAFIEDGDYTFTVACTDLADNTSEMVSVEPFTIDLTKPTIEIAYDNDTAQNDMYYGAPRMAFITVKEHNFREDDFALIAEPELLTGDWSHEGDEHHIRLTFAEDNHYRFQCNYTDLAGNTADSMEEQEFYIDTIAPQIVIQGVEDGSANGGNIEPVITVYDSNRNPEGVNITVITGVGESVPLAIQMQEAEQGYTYLLTDMSEKEDNVYFLNITASDMAGNICELTYRFSLNRNGSAYDLSEISDIVERVYNRTDQLSDIRITEMNVDKIEDYSIYITRNGKLLSCIEMPNRPKTDFGQNDVFYSVELTGDEKTGYRNQYIFYKENFAKEGLYRITCYSKDRAGNEMNNTLEEKKAEVSFVVDNTPPKVVIDGIEEGGIYNKELQTVHIMVQDNFMVKEARFYLMNQDGEELQSWDYLESVKTADGVMTITIPSREEKQFLVYQVSDAAGNEIVLLPDSESTPKGFLVTTNPWLQFISSPIKVTMAIMFVMILCGAGGYSYVLYKQGNKS